MKKAYEIVKKQIALGGYRLAELIKHIKKSFDHSKAKTEDKQNHSENKHKFLALLEN